MPSNQLHHTGLLVADIERAARFYIDALDAHYLFTPGTHDDPSAQKVFGGDEGVAFRFCYLGFEQGAVELIQFVDVDKAPEWARRPHGVALPHFGLIVDDVGASAQRIVDHGGRRVWDEPVSWGGDAQVQYVADPDGNVIELFDTDLQGIVDLTIAAFPETRP
jgi:catechol 2,3-dioxygenase-like lactoylglutathione lyase family enzyme